MWNQKVSLIAATDGGLGNDIGSSGYLILFDGEEIPIIEGWRGEMTRFENMASTREELIGLLAVEYIMQILVEMWGTPPNIIQLDFVVDSEPAIEARNKPVKGIDSKSTMRPNQEVLMELDGLQTTSIEWLRRDFIWT